MASELRPCRHLTKAFAIDKDKTFQFYYNRTEIYDKILKRQSLGCHTVPMVHSCVLINLRKQASYRLSYQHKKVAFENVPYDDIISFALSAKANNVSLVACNDEVMLLVFCSILHL
jgi:collagen beta-1,O-galactosyltransferase